MRYLFGNHAHMSVSLTLELPNTQYSRNSHKHACTLDWGFSTNGWVSRIKQHITMTTFLKQLKMPEKITWQPMTICTVCFCKTGSTFFYQIVYLLFAYCSHVSMCFWISLSRIYLGPLMMKNWLNFCIKNWMRGHIHFRLYLHMMGEHRNPTGSWGNLTLHEILKKWQF